MNDTWYVQKGVELCEGWTITHIYEGEDVIEFWDDEHHAGYARTESMPDLDCCLQRPKQCVLDALAAQLVRQVDATKHFAVQTSRRKSSVLHRQRTFDHRGHAQAHGPDRTMNTIRCIVDSKVLSDEG